MDTNAKLAEIRALIHGIRMLGERPRFGASDVAVIVALTMEKVSDAIMELDEALSNGEDLPSDWRTGHTTGAW